MEFKKITGFVLILLWMLIGGVKSQNTIKSSIAYDIDDLPIFTFQDSSLIYFNVHGRHFCSVEAAIYKYGKDSLQNYIEYTLSENVIHLGQSIYYSVFFDKHLNLLEIRLNNIGINNELKEKIIRLKIMDHIIRAIKKNKENWTNDRKGKYFFYYGMLKI